MHAVIISKGFPPSKELMEQEVRTADLVIGADGGGNILLAQGILPEVVIGDLDSFQKPDGAEFLIIHDPDQETNDLEKALMYAREQGVTSCTVLGAFGKRMDHSLKNLSVMQQFTSQFDRLTFLDDELEACMVGSEMVGQLPIGSIVSLFPLSGKVKGITTKGLKYALNDEELENGVRDGTSNENISRTFSIKVKEGQLVVFMERVKKS